MTKEYGSSQSIEVKCSNKELAQALVEKSDLRATPTLASHADWAEMIIKKYDQLTQENVMDILHEEIGLVFEQVLKDAGVYKCTEEGHAAFQRFISRVNES